MGRKLSAHGRKLKRQGGPVIALNGWLRTIEACKPVEEDPRLANSLLLMVHDALKKLLDHQAQPGETAPFDLLAHAIDVAHVRYMQIDPTTDNPAHDPMLAAKTALLAIRERYRRTGRWGLAGPERAPLIQGIDLYEQVLLASTPAQMMAATKIVMNGIKRGCFYNPQAVKA